MSAGTAGSNLRSREFTPTVYLLHLTVIGACQRDYGIFERMFVSAGADPCLSVQAGVGVRMLL